jgi:hypothetical protein
MRLVGYIVTHMERMGDEFRIIARRDNFGRSRERWDENTTMDLNDLRV